MGKQAGRARSRDRVVLEGLSGEPIADLLNDQGDRWHREDHEGQRLQPQSLFAGDSTFRYHDAVKAKHRKTLAAIFARPTRASIPFKEIEALIKGLGGAITEREGSRLKIELNGEQWRCHPPHPGKEAKRYQVEEARELMERVGVRP